MNGPKTSRELAALVRNSIQMDTSLSAIAREEKATAEAAVLIETYVAEAVFKEAEWWAENIERWFGGHSVVTREHLADVRREVEPRRMQPAGETNERNFGVKLERQGGE